MGRLAEFGSQRRVVEVHYRKHLTNAEPVPRLVEPYNFTYGPQDVILRCYQLEPDQGWRFFMVHKIDRVEDGGQPFEPRVRVALELEPPDGNGTEQRSSAQSKRVRDYRDLVLDAIADGKVTADERAAIEAFIRESELSHEERDFVHAALFHRCLGAIIEDGEITRQERDQIQFLQQVLTRLGWGVIMPQAGWTDLV